jgi:hypothetical protein
MLQAFDIKYSIHNYSKIGYNPFHFLNKCFFSDSPEDIVQNKFISKKQLLMAVTLHIVVFWFMTLCCLVGGYQCCGGTYYFNLRDRSEPKKMQSSLWRHSIFIQNVSIPVWTL